jgi:predicted nuclease of predicted toxin-antitoxin system
VARFLLDENLPPRAAELLRLFGFDFVAVGEPGLPPKSSSDADIARWCGANGVVWVTLDRGVLKDQAIAAAVTQARTSILLLAARGMTARDYLYLFVARYNRLQQTFERELQEGRVARYRQGRRGGLRSI